MTPESFKSLILYVTGAIHKEHPDTFERYFIKGNVHCLDDYSYKVGGLSFWTWIAEMVTNDPKWTDTLE